MLAVADIREHVTAIVAKKCIQPSVNRDEFRWQVCLETYQGTNFYNS
jgi:hypothetical protein